MNFIIMDKSCMSAFSDIINADDHKHWMLQLFYSFDNDLQITVNDNEITCKCIAVNTDVVHSFKTQNRLHFTMLIDVSSPLFLELKNEYLKNKEYYIFDNEILANIRSTLLPKQPINIQWYECFVSTFFQTLGINIRPCTAYDERVLEVIKQLDTCDCSDTI